MVKTVMGYRYASTEAWEKARADLRGYGASDIAAVLGPLQHPYMTRFELWARRTGRLPPVEPTAAMRSGHYAEAGWLRWYADETGRAVWNASGETPIIVPHPTDPLATCSPDGFVCGGQGPGAFAIDFVDADPRHPTGGFVGGVKFDGGVDAKNHSERILSPDREPGVTGYGPPGSDVVPRYIWWQAQWSCYCTGAPWWDIAAVFGGQKFHAYRVPRSDRAIELAAEAVARFEEDHVQADTPPDETAAGWRRVEDSLRAMFPTSTDAVLVAEQSDLDDVYRWYHARRVAGLFDDVAETYKAKLIRRMEDAGVMALGTEAGPAILTYKGGGEPKPVVDWEATAKAIASDALLSNDIVGDARDVDGVVRSYTVTKPGRKPSRSMLLKLTTSEKVAALLAKAADLGYDLAGYEATADALGWPVHDAANMIAPDAPNTQEQER